MAQRERAPEGYADIITWTTSEDGQCWYDAMHLFQDDTIKVMYDELGRICAKIDAPVPRFNNTYSAEMLFPWAHSVAEIAQEDWPEGVTLDGTWYYEDGVVVRRLPDPATRKPTSAEKIASLEERLLAMEARLARTQS